jgi:hypothetical protein
MKDGSRNSTGADAVVAFRNRTRVNTSHDENNSTRSPQGPTQSGLLRGIALGPELGTKLGLLVVGSRDWTDTTHLALDLVLTQQLVFGCGLYLAPRWALCLVQHWMFLSLRLLRYEGAEPNGLPC